MNQTHEFSVFKSLKAKNLFITGATGFLGKVLVEKILREIPEAGTISILVRAENTSDAWQRLNDELLNVELFDNLKGLYGPDFERFIKNKLVPVAGSLTEHRFGLSEAGFAQLASTTDLIINSAASVNFREPVDQALEINTFSLHNIASLAREGAKARRILPVVHISTCYVNGHHNGVIREEIRGAANGTLKQLTEHTYQIAPVLDELQRNISKIKEQGQSERQKRQQLTGLGVETARRFGWNDTYTFTKWLGEQVILQDLKPQNVTIIRPSIIESAVFMPRPGWIEGIKVADAMINAYARKRLMVFPGNNNGVVDIIPVDLVANATILALAERADNARGVRIYQCCSGKLNPITISAFSDLVYNEMRENYHQYPNLIPERPNQKFRLVPASLLKLYLKGLTNMVSIQHFLSKLLGRKAKTNMARRLSTTLEMIVIYGFYTAPGYRFDSSGLEQLFNRIPTNEQQQFCVRSDSFEWQHYIQKVHLPGLNRYATGTTASKLEHTTVQEGKADYKIA